MTKSLRERQRELTRRVILEAAAEVVTEQGVQSFSVEDVADRAGVSARTLYRYFESREGLLLGIGGRLTEQIDAARREADVDRHLDDDVDDLTLTECIRMLTNTFAVFSEHETLTRATVAISGLAERSDAPEAFAAAGEARRARSARIREAIATELPRLPDETIDQIYAVTRLLGSINGWHHVTGPSANLDGDDASVAIQWALHALLERAKQMQELGMQSLAEDMP